MYHPRSNPDNAPNVQHYTFRVCVCVCAHTDTKITCTDTISSHPQPLVRLGTPVKVAGNGSGTKKATIDTVPE